MEISIGISSIAILISLLSYMFARRSWYETYRPIVTARIETHASGNMATVFNIVVYNTGNRPATDIRLGAKRKVLDDSFAENASDPMRNEIRACFSDEGKIPLLHSGHSVSNGFGLASRNETTLRYGTIIPVIIEYKDVNRRKYRSKQALIFRDTTYFAGSGWSQRDL